MPYSGRGVGGMGADTEFYSEIGPWRGGNGVQMAVFSLVGGKNGV